MIFFFHDCSNSFEHLLFLEEIFLFCFVFGIIPHDNVVVLIVFVKGLAGHAAGRTEPESCARGLLCVKQGQKGEVNSYFIFKNGSLRKFADRLGVKPGKQ